MEQGETGTRHRSARTGATHWGHGYYTLKRRSKIAAGGCVWGAWIVSLEEQNGLKEPRQLPAPADVDGEERLGLGQKMCVVQRTGTPLYVKWKSPSPATANPAISFLTRYTQRHNKQTNTKQATPHHRPTARAPASIASPRPSRGRHSPTPTIQPHSPMKTRHKRREEDDDHGLDHDKCRRRRRSKEGSGTRNVMLLPLRQLLTRGWPAASPPGVFLACLVLVLLLLQVVW